MKVKIGDKVYDGETEPVMVILSEQDKLNISNMLPDNTKYCSYPDDYTQEDIKRWMKL